MIHNYRTIPTILSLFLAIIIGIVSIIFGGSLMNSQAVIGNPYGFDTNQDTYIINIFLGVIITGVSYLFITSLFNRNDLSHKTTKLFTSIGAMITSSIFLLSALLAIWGVSKASSRSTSYWEKIPIANQNFVYLDLFTQFNTGPISCVYCDLVHTDYLTILGDRKPVLFMHPSSEVTYRIDVPHGAQLIFNIALVPSVWNPDSGDGVGFSVLLTDGATKDTLFYKYIDPKNNIEDRDWDSNQIDLSPWTGRTVMITFATDPGPNADNRFDWAVWGEPRIVLPITYDFLKELPKAVIDESNEKLVRQDTITIDGEMRSALFQHPTSQVSYSVNLTKHAYMYFGLGMDPVDWSVNKSDGVEYNIYVRSHDEPDGQYQVFHRYLDPSKSPEDRHWIDQVVDLSDYGGQAVDIIFEALPGPAGNDSFDWGGWSSPVLVDP